jgi:hypothetical protein
MKVGKETLSQSVPSHVIWFLKFRRWVLTHWISGRWREGGGGHPCSTLVAALTLVPSGSQGLVVMPTRRIACPRATAAPT